MTVGIILPSTPSPVSRQIGRSDTGRMFRAAARHSRLVHFLRVAIPVAIATIAAVILLATFFNPFRLIAAFPIDPGKISLSGTKIIMELPRLNGFTTDSRPYELTARSAAQDLAKPDVMELNDIRLWLNPRTGNTSPSSRSVGFTTPKASY